MSRLNAKYKFGFSATPYRADGLTKVIHFATGPKIFKVPEEKLKDVLVTPSYKQVHTDYYFPLIDSTEYQNMISDLSFDELRNDLIIDQVQNHYADKYICLLCTRVGQVKTLKERLGDDAVMLTSKMPKKKRKEVMRLLKNKEKKYIVSTYSLFSTGIDLPHLDTLFLCSPMKSEIILRQAAGRLMRKAPNKTEAIIVDFVDVKLDILKYQAYTRKRLFNSIKG